MSHVEVMVLERRLGETTAELRKLKSDIEAMHKSLAHALTGHFKSMKELFGELPCRRKKKCPR